VCVKTALRTEYAALCRMTHPNVVRAFALVTVVPAPGIAMLMPHMAGNLWEWVVQGPEAADASAVAGPHDMHMPFVQRSVLLQVAAGVAHIHARHIVHCDLKPDNVLVDRLSDAMDRGGGGVRCQVADFGVCQAMAEIDGVPSGGRVQADEVNTETYRPFWLFRQSSSVILTPLFDVWALAGIVFDVAQAPRQRLRNRDGEYIRFMTGVAMSGKEPAYKAMCLERNRRVLQHARPCVRAIILAAQPPSPSKHAPTASDVAHRLLKLQCPPCRECITEHGCAAVAADSAVAAESAAMTNSAAVPESPAASLLRQLATPSR
jgi:serine/threonine protein kinase